jgi:hypothetical protein
MASALAVRYQVHQSGISQLLYGVASGRELVRRPLREALRPGERQFKSTVGMPAKRCVIATMAPVGAHQQYPGRPAPPCGYHFLMAISE